MQVLPDEPDERQHIGCAAGELIESLRWRGLRLDGVYRCDGACELGSRRHFVDANGLLVALLESELRSVFARLRHAAEPSKSPRQRIHSYIAEIIDCAYPVERAGWTSLLASTWLGTPEHDVEQIEAHLGRLVQPLREAIQDGSRLGAVASQNPDDDANSIFHLVTGRIVTQAALGRRTPRERLESEIQGMVTHALGMTGH